MFVEDLVITLYLNKVSMLPAYEESLLASIYTQLLSGIGMTEKQQNVILKILTKHKNILCDKIGQDVSNHLENPVFKIPARKIITSNTISVVDYKGWGRALKVGFPYSVEKINKIKESTPQLGFFTWSTTEKHWFFSVDERNILFLMTLFSNEEIDLDEETADYMSQCKKIIENIEDHVPCVTLVNNIPVYRNVSKYVPVLKSTEVIPALFEAKFSGISTWDTDINDAFNASTISNPARLFLSTTDTQFKINSDDFPLSDLADIIKYSAPVMFVIPGGSELEYTTKVYNLLTVLGIDSGEISVMFRLANSKNKKFNEFVKEHNLNNPITSKTKFVFISTKVNKTVVKSNMQFNCVINLGYTGVHYSLREFSKEFNNLIYYFKM